MPEKTNNVLNDLRNAHPIVGRATHLYGALVRAIAPYWGVGQVGGRARRSCAGVPPSHAKIGFHNGSSNMNENILHDIDRRIREVLAQSPAADLEKNLRALLSSALTKLDLVSREEFDIQRQVLVRTREKLALLETQVAALERALASRDSDTGSR